MTQQEEAQKDRGNYYYGTGRRKNAIARVRIYNMPGEVVVNEKPAETVFPTHQWISEALKPLEVVGLTGKVTVEAKTHGGGVHGQVGAFSHGLARALIVMDEKLRPDIKKAGLLTRDPRMKESKKYGLRRARKAPQYTKR